MAAPDRPRIASFFIGGTVEKANAGEMLEALFLVSGLGIRQRLVVEVDQLEGAPAVNGVTPGLSHDEALALPSPKKKAAEPGTKGDARPMDVLVAALRKKPLAYNEIGKALKTAGYGENSSLVFRATKAGIIKKTAKGYALTAKGRALPTTHGKTIKSAAEPVKKKTRAKKREFSHHPDGLSHVQYVEKMLSGCQPNPMRVEDMKSAFEHLGMRPESVSVALTTLKQAGKVKSVETGVVVYVPESDR